MEVLAQRRHQWSIKRTDTIWEAGVGVLVGIGMGGFFFLYDRMDGRVKENKLNGDW